MSKSKTQKSKEDCHFYYNSSCIRNEHCPFRHEPNALGNETVCRNWLHGICKQRNCKFRHTKITVPRKRGEIQCYHEKTIGGCRKDDCPYKHGDGTSSDDEDEDGAASSRQNRKYSTTTSSESSDAEDSWEGPASDNQKSSSSSDEVDSDNQKSFSSSSSLEGLREDLSRIKVNSGNSNRLTTRWSSELSGEVSVPEICFSSVEYICPREESGCERLHSSDHFYWQIKEPEHFWMNLPTMQVQALEINFCDPYVKTFMLPTLDPKTVDSYSKALVETMRERSWWCVNFKEMILTSTDNNVQLNLRRLCTESIQHKIIPACTYVWYFLDEHNWWIEYGKTDVVGKVSARSISSNEIENHYQKQPKKLLPVENGIYELNVNKMFQRNTTTNTECPIIRRPRSHLKPKVSSSTPKKITKPFLCKKL